MTTGDQEFLPPGVDRVLSRVEGALTWPDAPWDCTLEDAKILAAEIRRVRDEPRLVADMTHELMLDHGCILNNPRQARACRACSRRAQLIYDKVIDRPRTVDE